MFISNKEKEKIVDNIKYLLEKNVDFGQTFLLIFEKLEKLEKASKPAPKKRGRPPLPKPKRRGRPPKVQTNGKTTGTRKTQK